MTHGLQFHGGVFAQKLARHLVDEGYPIEDVLAGIPEERRFLEAENLMLPLHEHATFLEQSVELTGNDTLGVEFAASCTLLDIGVVGYLVRSSATLKDALEALANYSILFTHAWSADVRRLETQGIFSWGYESGQQLTLSQCAEFTAAMLLQSFAGWCTEDVTPLRASFQHQRSANIDVLMARYGVRPIFGAELNALQFSKATLAIPLTTHDPRLRDILRDYADLLVEQGRNATDHLVVLVEKQILSQLSEGGATLPSVAEQMGMSPRTLSRKLSQEGTSFFAILEGLRQSMAIRYLKDPNMTLAEISYLLGYSSLSSFNDAFKRWTGKSPGAARMK